MVSDQSPLLLGTNLDISVDISNFSSGWLRTIWPAGLFSDYWFVRMALQSSVGVVDVKGERIGVYRIKRP